jgi:hypothetical protein
LDVDARGAQIESQRVIELMTSLVGAASGAVRQSIDLRDACIQGNINLTGFSLQSPLRLAGAQIDGDLTISGLRGLTHLQLGAPASRRTSMHSLQLHDCEEEQAEWTIAEVDIADRVRLNNVRLRYLGLDGCRLGRLLTITDVTLEDGFEIRRCAWDESSAEHLRVSGGLTVNDVQANTLTLRACRFEAWSDLFIRASLAAKRCSFSGPTRIRLQAAWWVTEQLDGEGPRHAVRVDDLDRPLEEDEASLELESVRFESAAHLRWAGGPVALPGTLFAGASSLDQAPDASRRPILTDVREMDGANLRIQGVRMAECRFSAAAALGAIHSTRLPFGRGTAGITRRHYLADEHQHPRMGWRHRRRLRAERRNSAYTLNATYRDLRIGAEAVGNFAGANDLHYGERLWHRKAVSLGSAQWWWLAAYGLVGYGVRPWRPLALLVAVVLAATFLFAIDDGLRRERLVKGDAKERVSALCQRAGDPGTPAGRQRVFCPADFGERLEFSVRTSTTLIRPAAGYETRGIATAVDIVVRLLAALFFGLFLLAMRNRVHR